MGLIYQLAEGPEVICPDTAGLRKQALEKLEKSDHQEASRKWAERGGGPMAAAPDNYHLLQPR